jgi:hypothetical protein
MRFDGGSLRFDTTIDSQYAQLSGKGSLPWNGGHIDARTPLAATATCPCHRWQHWRNCLHPRWNWVASCLPIWR